MKTISIHNLSDIVRVNLDEIGLNDSMMMGAEDDIALNEIVGKVAGVCADEVHTSAPAHMLDGVDVALNADTVKADEKDATVLRLFPGDIVRLVAFRAEDSEYTISRVVAEDSPEGRKQKSAYVRGTYDDPVMVAIQGKAGRDTELRYYSLSEESDPLASVAQFRVIMRQISGAGYVQVADNVVPHFYNLVTSRVLSILGETVKSQEYAAKASFA